MLKIKYDTIELNQDILHRRLVPQGTGLIIPNITNWSPYDASTLWGHATRHHRPSLTQ